MLKTSPKPAIALLATSVNNSELVGSSSRNNKKSAKSDFIKPKRRVEEPSFLILNDGRVFT